MAKDAKDPKKKGRIRNFFKGVWSELKKVHWPNRKQVANYTVVVITFVIIMGVALFIVDSALSFVMGKLLMGS